MNEVYLKISQMLLILYTNFLPIFHYISDFVEKSMSNHLGKEFSRIKYLNAAQFEC